MYPLAFKSFFWLETDMQGGHYCYILWFRTSLFCSSWFETFPLLGFARALPPTRRTGGVGDALLVGVYAKRVCVARHSDAHYF